jgi:hypothetical protein
MVVVERIGPVSQLERELLWLDRILADAVERQREQGRWRGEDDLRGVYISPEVASSILAGRAIDRDSSADAAAVLGRSDCTEDAHELPMTRLWERFELGDFERFVLLLALAPELDSRYRAVLGYLNDDLALGLPTVALALDLYAGAGPQSASLRHALRPDQTLVRFRLIRLRAPTGVQSLLRHGIEVDDWLVGRLVGGPADPRESGFALEQACATEPGARKPGACQAGAWQAGGDCGRLPLLVVSGDRRAALDHALATVGGPLLIAVEDGRSLSEETLLSAARRARLDGLGVALTARTLRDAALVQCAGELAETMPVVVTTEDDEADALPDEWPRLRLPEVSTSERRARWEQRLREAGVNVAGKAVAEIAASHAIALDRIDAAVTRLATESATRPRTRDELRAAARGVARHELGGLARRVAAGRSWSDLVLPVPLIGQLHEIAAAVRDRPRVLQEWGFGERPGGRGTHILFSGPSGTGKTLAASVIADEAGYALYAVDLARVVDKYLGETEKQLDRVFDEATAAGAMLLFDEADALFGQRAEVHDARDRYANVEIAYLLQRLDAHDGVTVLATNLPHHLDQAFTRRLHHRIEFPVPDPELRRRLWRAVLPPAAPLAADLDLDLIAARFELAGGAIRNAALTAAYLAAADGCTIGLGEIVRAVARELEKGGRPATRSEFRELFELLGPSGEGPE